MNVLAMAARILDNNLHVHALLRIDISQEQTSFPHHHPPPPECHGQNPDMLAINLVKIIQARLQLSAFCPGARRTEPERGEAARGSAVNTPMRMNARVHKHLKRHAVISQSSKMIKRAWL